MDGMFAIIDGLGWQSDWNGHEVGFPEIDAVGYYTKAVRFFSDDEETILNLYVNIEDGRVLAMWLDPPDEEGEEDGDWMDNDWDDEDGDFY